MARDWPSIALDQLTDQPITYGVVKPGPEDPAGLRFIRGGDIANGRIAVDSLRTITHEISQQYRRTLLRGGELVISLVGNPGQVAIVPESLCGANIARQVGLVRLSARVDARFVKYALLSPLGQSALGAHSIGSVQQVINLSDLRTVKVPVPPLSEQRAIASILGALDDKIELNARMNRTLEAMARAIFKSWFVDFDPVRAKMEGRKPSGMDDATAALFPDSFKDSELGLIPKGWRLAELGEIAHVVDCLHSKKPIREEEGRPLLQLCNIRDDGLIDMSDTYLISKDDYEQWISRMEAQPGDCVITNVGRVGAVAQIPMGVRAALGRNMTGMRVKPGYPCPTFLIECLLSSWMREEIVRKSDAGTILDALNVRSIPKLRILLPPQEAILKEFERICRPLRAKMEADLSESHHLASIRDALLPTLISGQVGVLRSFSEDQTNT